ncbi:Uncharacterized membrane protein HdeD, DUF308 family [Cognatiyoonia koreensis]|uniref:Uncharacterized membrane protein HdeD, DUF308 family n=1 Tax=Cognatiyoonia koreensis TaxID=364200 RepID=A0A1I0RWY1_9RHOB|nr:DUF308 domain-containing protein [Cognatiyoonia koreensis]SEW46007.1 Uncharacterized membrane protein HdeD, DUF308 family [Cognatiyoonia koreensis]
MHGRILHIVSGIVLMLGGLLAFLLPQLASLTATLIVGWSFILAGVLHIVEAFRESEDRLWNGAFGVLGVLLGLSFLINPFGGMVSLTIVLGAAFFASGIMQLYLAGKRFRTYSIWMLAISGIVSVALAVMIAFNLFTAAVTVPGILLAIELMTTGIALIMLRPDARKQTDPATASV